MQDFRRPTHTTSSLGVVNAERGFSMLEVMISMFILATGLFGLIGVQLMAHKSELDSYQRAQALVLLGDIIDRINLNRKAATCYAITTSATNGTPFLGASGSGSYSTGSYSCSSLASNVQASTRAQNDLQQIDAALKGAAEALSGNQVGAMIGARGCIGYDSTTQRYVVAVAWQGSSAGFDPTGWTAAPDVAKNCAKGLYGAENMRRVVWNTLMVANLS